MAAGLCWVAFGLILVVMRYGSVMRSAGARREGREEDPDLLHDEESGTTLDSNSAKVRSQAK